MGKRKQMKKIIERLYKYYFNNPNAEEEINSIMVDLESLTEIELTNDEIDLILDECRD